LERPSWTRQPQRAPVYVKNTVVFHITTVFISSFYIFFIFGIAVQSASNIMPGSEGDEYNSVVSLLEREEPG